MTADRPGLLKAVSESSGLRHSENSSDHDAVGGGGAVVNGNGGLNDDANLNREVAALSNKLISAINHQTQLDDSLATTKHELEISRAKIRQLETRAKEHADMMASGLLVEKKDVETETQQLLNRLTEERTQRGKAEKDKRNIEQELETLTTALFDEANKMVSAARKERDAMDKKNEQLRAQLADTEMLLASHQEQLAELKLVMQQMTADREEAEMNMSTGTPSTPALNNRSSKDSFARMFDSLHLPTNPASPEEIQPTHPTSLSNFIHTVLRHDIGAYTDFCEVMHAPKPPAKTSQMPRLSSGSFTGIQVMGMGLSGYSSSPSNSPTGLTGGLFGNKNRDIDSRPSSPSPSVTPNSNNGAQGQQQTGLGLKETKFWKRVLVEDIEPTLRLDNAPGLSWLARRNVLSAITDGSLVIDPLPATPAKPNNVLSCTLCGENRNDEDHARTHRMRTSENANAQQYPLCTYCVTRTRSVCDFVAFLRTLKEGLWKTDTEGAEKHAWEESVKLRERMFWSRIGGGVIPAFFLHHSHSQSQPQPHLHQEPQIKLEVPKKRGGHDRMPSLTEDRVTGKEWVVSPVGLEEEVVVVEEEDKRESSIEDVELPVSVEQEVVVGGDIKETVLELVSSPMGEVFKTPKGTPGIDAGEHAVPGAW